MTTQISFKPSQSKVVQRLIIGEKSRFASKDLTSLANGADLSSAALAVSEGKADAASVYTKDQQITLVNLKNEGKRNLGNIRSDLLSDLITKNLVKEGDVHITLCLENIKQVLPTAPAIARTCPQFSKKSEQKPSRNITVDYQLAQGSVDDATVAELERLTQATRLAARLIDTPPCFLNTTTYTDEIRKLVAEHKDVKMTVIVGKELEERGMGGIWSVGKCAAEPPAMIILEHRPAGVGKNSLGLVGKGIVYDSGGLSIKPTAGMCHMKGDMGGSAGILAAFLALVASKIEMQVTAILCLAENAVGPNSYRNDDIVTPYSGKTIEINNTDAEGRVVLADGVAYMSKEIKPTHIMTMATLTGAQLVTTGTTFAALLSNDADFEKTVYQAGQDSGDFTFPVLYAPELLLPLFDSKVADMKNSVSDRMNAQCSAAGHFIEAHLDKEWTKTGRFAHIDMAGPSFLNDRARGYGPALLIETAKKLQASS